MLVGVGVALVVVVAGGQPEGLTHSRTREPLGAWAPGAGPERQTRPGSAAAPAASVSQAAWVSGVRPAWSSRRRAISSGWPRTSGTSVTPSPPAPAASTATVSSTGAPAGRAAPPAGDWASTVPGAAASSTRSRCTSDSPASSSHRAALVTGTPTSAGTTPSTGRPGSRQVRVGADAFR